MSVSIKFAGYTGIYITDSKILLIIHGSVLQVLLQLVELCGWDSGAIVFYGNDDRIVSVSC